MISKAVNSRGPNSVLVTSFTRAAAMELIGRAPPIDPNMVGTLHAICYRALGRPEIAETKIKEWNEFCKPSFRLSSRSKSAMDDPYDMTLRLGAEADEVFMLLQRLRGMMVPKDSWPIHVQEFSTEWELWKMSCGYVDFTDMIEMAYQEIEFPPGDPSVLMHDEAQDSTPLQWALLRKWAKHVDDFIAVGDPDQCSTRGTLVLTSQGYKAIEELDPKNDRLVTYDRLHSTILGLSDGMKFDIAQRHYAGEVVRIAAGENETVTTTDHIWEVHWSKKARNKCVVYAMRKGRKVRIGWCQLFNSEGTFHLGVRSRLEKADQTWILDIFDDSSEATLYEDYVAAQWGLPMLTFRHVQRVSYTPKQHEAIWERLERNVDMINRLEKCLHTHGRSIKYPFYEPNYVKKGFSSIFPVRAMNLLSGMMTVPVHIKGKKFVWKEIEVSRTGYNGMVYSLNVDTYHRYIADGIVTHNCLYDWLGALSTSMIAPPIPDSHKRILKQSYRLPRAVHEVSQRWIQQIDVREKQTCAPRDADGAVIDSSANCKDVRATLDTIEMLLCDHETVMILASCGYMLSPLLQAMKHMGMPFFNPYRRAHGGWNPLNPSIIEKVMAFTRPNEQLWGSKAVMWTYDDLKQWVPMLKSKNILKRGAKKLLQGIYDEELDDRPSIQWLLENIFEERPFSHVFDCDLGWFASNLLSSRPKTIDYVIRVLEKHGGSALLKQPRLITGTIHSVKGGESDAVILFPDISPSANRTRLATRDGNESLLRTFYVGMTRARETLVLADGVEDELRVMW